MSDSVRLLSLRATLAGRWQIPLLVAGAVVLGAGFAQMARERHRVSFDEQLALVAKLRGAKAYLRASAYLSDQLKKPGRPSAERAELARLLAGVIHDAEAPLTDHDPYNARGIISNFHIAQRCGAELRSEDWAALADAYQWSGDRGESADAYRQAIRLSASASVGLRMRLLALLLGTDENRGGRGPALTPETLAHLDAILASETAAPGEYYWALDKEVSWWLNQQEPSKALELVDAARDRLAGAEEKLAVSYLQGLCLYHAGRPDHAEAVLRTLRDEWTARDDLWGRTTWLLGKIQQEDDRPQTALAFFDEVLQSFRTGYARDVCQVGRAECLSALRRFEDALATYQEVTAAYRSRSGEGAWDRDAIRTSLATVGESLLNDKSLETGIAFYELALHWVDEANRPVRAYFLNRIADGLSEWARQSKAPARAQELFAKAAEMRLALGEMSEVNSDAAARSYESAAAEFDAAGLSPRVIEVLKNYAAKHPDGIWRSTALYKLGRTHQAEHRYEEAIAAFEEVLKAYPRMPDALRSVVPLAECLLAAGDGESQDAKARHARGVELLIGIVDDRGADQLFAPSAAEYRDALYRLAEHYSRTTDQDAPARFERAVLRWEDWLALYPHDARVPRARFMLADAYRQSGLRVRQAATTRPVDSSRDEWAAEANRRLASAEAQYQRVIAALAPMDAGTLEAVEETYLRASFLYRADCLFDLGRYAEAIEAYREAAWRYENDPAAVSASMQIVHAFKRAGQIAEAEAALARVRWLLAKIPESAFDAMLGHARKQHWTATVQRLEEAGLD